MIFVSCEIEYCAYNRYGECGKESIHVERKNFSGFKSGEREWAPACEDYKDIEEDDGTD